MTPTKKPWRRERGQALVEFAITVPVLLFLILGLLDVGDGMNSYLTVLASARDAARLGAQNNVGTTNSTLLTLVGNETNRLRTSLPTGSNNCTNTAGVCIHGVSDTWTVSSESAIYVKVCYDYNLLVPFAGALLNPMRMCSTTQMRKAV